MEIWNYVIQESARKVCQIQTIKEVNSLNDLTELEGGGGTRNYEGQGCLLPHQKIQSAWERVRKETVMKGKQNQARWF